MGWKGYEGFSCYATFQLLNGFNMFKSLVLASMLATFVVGQINSDKLWNLIVRLNVERLQLRQSEILDQVNGQLLNESIQDFEDNALNGFLRKELKDMVQESDIQVGIYLLTAADEVNFVSSFAGYQGQDLGEHPTPADSIRREFSLLLLDW